MGVLNACGKEPSQEDAPTATAAPGTIPDNSILYYNGDAGSAKLIRAFEEGNIPTEANILYDQMGSNPDITIRDAETIRKLYELLRVVQVNGESNMSITDCYHHISFKLAENEYVSYFFEGSELWCCGQTNYDISNGTKLFSFMLELTKEQCELMEEEEASVESDEAALFREESFDALSFAAPAGWSAVKLNDGMMRMSRDGTDQPPFISVQKLEFTGSPEEYVTERMDSFTARYQNRVSKQPESAESYSECMPLSGFVAAYSAEDGSCTLTRYEYVASLGESRYLISCEYVSQAYGDLHEDETTYFEFMNFLESLKETAE